MPNFMAAYRQTEDSPDSKPIRRGSPVVQLNKVSVIESSGVGDNYVGEIR